MNSGGYIVCTSPRSGSTLLCRLLAATGIAGDPESLFFRPSLDDWETGLGLSSEGATGRTRLSAILRAAIRAGCGRTPVFGLRQQRHGFDFLCGQLALFHPDATTDLDRLTRTFGPLRFIHLRRDDKLAQAVSYLKAQQTGLWHVAVDGSDWERTGPPQPPVYDIDRIRDCMRLFESYDRGWNAWFDAQGIVPLRVTYAELSAAPVATLARVLDALGLDPSAASGIAPEVRRMADATSTDWIARFQAETATR